VSTTLRKEKVGNKETCKKRKKKENNTIKKYHVEE
jgi:hypothetical protein